MVKNALCASISQFKNNFKADNRSISLMQLNLFTYLLEGYYMNKCNEDSLFDSDFYELDNIPSNIYNEGYIESSVDSSHLLPPLLKKFVDDIYDSFKDLSAAELAAIADDCHNNNHTRIYNHKKTAPLDKKYAKTWFRNSFLQFENDHYVISPFKVKSKTNITIYDYVYEKSEVYCDLVGYQNNEDMIANYAKEFLELGKRDGIIIDPIRLNTLMYLLEGYYTSNEKKPFLFKHNFEADENGPMLPALIVLYNHILSQTPESGDEEYKNYYNYDSHLPIFYVKKIYDLYGKVSTAELNELFMKYRSPYNIIASYASNGHFTIPKKMTAEWINANQANLENDASKMKSEIAKKKLRDGKKVIIRPTCVYHTYVYRKNSSVEDVKEFVNGRSVLVNGTKYMANRFHVDRKSLDLNQLNMIMYLAEGFYMGMENTKSLYAKDFRVVDGVPTIDLIKYVVADSIENNVVKVKQPYSLSLDQDKREFFDYMYAVFNDISVKDLKTLCKMTNSPINIVEKYTQNEYSVVPKGMTSGWLTEEFLKDGKKKITTCDLKVKIKNKAA